MRIFRRICVKLYAPTSGVAFMPTKISGDGYLKGRDEMFLKEGVF